MKRLLLALCLTLAASAAASAQITVSPAPAASPTPAGSDTQLQRNNGGSFGAVTGATSDGTNLTVFDGSLFVAGSSDATKQFRFEADTNIPTGTTIVGTLPASSFTFARTDAAQNFTGAQGVQAGASSSFAAVGGVLCRNFTAASTLTTSDESLMTCTVPASALASNGQFLKIRIYGTYAANANTKVVTLKFGPTTIVTRSASSNGIQWNIEAIVGRTGASTQVSGAELRAGSTSLSYVGSTAAPAETLSGAVTIDLRATTGSAAGDVTALFMIVEAGN